MTHPHAKLTLVRNPSWLASVRLALRIAILWAPTRLLISVRTPFLTMVTAAAMVLVGVALFVFETALILVAGLLGRVTEPDVSNRA